MHGAQERSSVKQTGRPIGLATLSGVPPMIKRTAFLLAFSILAAPIALIAQSAYQSSSLVFPEAISDGGAGQAPSPYLTSTGTSARPLSHIGFGVGISPLGIQLEAATNLSSHFNLRGTDNF